MQRKHDWWAIPMGTTRVKPLWQILSPDPKTVKTLEDTHKVPPVVAAVMVNRGITLETAAKFLEPSLMSFSDPTMMSGLPEAASLFADTIINGKSICFYSDFDQDGIASAALLKRFADSVGAQSFTFLPHRIDNGYGLHVDCLETILNAGAELVVTSDCGITAIDAARYCRSRNIPLIITDHHTPKPELPDAILVNPLLPNCRYPYKKLAGVGVAFCLAIATRKALREKGYFESHQEPGLADLLPFVCLGTIGDMMELTSENRILVTQGLKRLYTNTGIQALAKVSGLNLSETPSAGQVAFRMIPRINASGRMESALAALDLLTSDDPDFADKLAAELDALNKDRQAEEERVLIEIEASFEKDPSLLQRNTIVAVGNYHPGVIGLAASRLVERYHRPTVVISDMGDGKGKGSCRSIKAFNIYDGLTACAGMLVGYGGHPAAAGLSLKLEHLEAFQNVFEKAAAHLTSDDLRPILEIDGEIPPEHLNLTTVQDLSMLEPYGMGNRTPVFCIKSVKVSEVRILKGKHLKMLVKTGGSTVGAIQFNMDSAEAPAVGDSIDIAFTMDSNEWNGKRSLQLMIKDIRISP
jgi:single-stranded-DNA-specific exonuclease